MRRTWFRKSVYRKLSTKNLDLPLIDNDDFEDHENIALENQV